MFHSSVTFHYQLESVISNMYGTHCTTFMAQLPGAWQGPWLQKDKVSNSLTNRAQRGICQQRAT